MSLNSISTRTVVAFVAVLALAIALWMLLLTPKREEADKLNKAVEQQQQQLSTAHAKATEALTAKKAFPTDYQHLVVLGKAVPEGDETASLLVLLSRISDKAKVGFESLSLEGGGGSGETATAVAPEAGPTSAPTPVPPTEAEAALLPLGATIGTANLAVMPYHLTFDGNFFQIADFIGRIERQVQTGKKGLVVDGRLITIDGFSMAGSGPGEPKLTAEFSTNTFLTPPSQGGEGSPALATGSESVVPAGEAETAETESGTPSAYTTGEAE